MEANQQTERIMPSSLRLEDNLVILASGDNLQPFIFYLSQNPKLAYQELRDGFNNEKGNRERLLLTMAVPAGIDTIEKGFDIRSLNR